MNNNYYSELDNYPNIKRLLQKQAGFITPSAPATGGPGSGKEMPRYTGGFKMPSAPATGGPGLSDGVDKPNPNIWKDLYNKPIGFYSKPASIPHEALQIGINTPFMRNAKLPEGLIGGKPLTRDELIDRYKNGNNNNNPTNSNTNIWKDLYNKPIGFYSKPIEVPHEALQIGINTPFMRNAKLPEGINLPGFKMPSIPATEGTGSSWFGR